MTSLPISRFRQVMSAMTFLLLAVAYYAQATNLYYLGPHRDYEVSLSYNVNPYVVINKMTWSEDGTANRREVWAGANDKTLALLSLLNATQLQPPILNGNYQVNYEENQVSNTMSIDKITGVDQNTTLTLLGRLLHCGAAAVGNAAFDCEPKADYSLTFLYADLQDTDRITSHITLDIKVTPLELLHEPHVTLAYSTHSDESFFGFGEQFTIFNMRGYHVPVLVSEQGVGRGLQPVSDYYNKDVATGAGGDWYTTYAPKPLYTTSYNRSFALETSVTSFFDLDCSNKGSNIIRVEVWDQSFRARLYSDVSMLEAVQSLTSFTGRQRPLPVWTQTGAIVALEQFSTSTRVNNVSATVDQLVEGGVPLAGVWLQDWVGMRHSDVDGDRLIWNWEVNYDYYPHWTGMVGAWQKQNIRTLTYLNPFFSDPETFVDNIRHNFYQEGLANGYFVHKRVAGGTGLEVYMMQSLTITFATLDLTNPAARRWMKDIIINYSLVEAMSSGWMCDFGEYLPFDAVMFDNSTGATYHNKYPEAWAQLTREAIDEYYASVGKETNAADEVIFFTRSAWTQSPAYTPVFWLGDQLQSYDIYDGLNSVIVGALSSGLSGHALTHSDIGGYNAVKKEDTEYGPLVYLRSSELLRRWSELAAFGSSLFRTHIGSSTDPSIAQVYDSPESIAHFAEFASIYANLSSFRMQLMDNAQKYGHPLIRPVMLHYAYDANTRNLLNEYLVGDELLVAPCMQEGAVTTSVYLPAYSGPWVHLWSGRQFDNIGAEGLALTVPSKLGFPAVFYQPSSVVGNQLRGFVAENNYTVGFIWNLDDDEPNTDDIFPDSGGGTKNWWLKLPLVYQVVYIVVPALILLAAVGYIYFIYPRVKEERRKKAYTALQVSEDIRNSINRDGLRDDSLMYSSLLPKDCHHQRDSIA